MPVTRFVAPGPAGRHAHARLARRAAHNLPPQTRRPARAAAGYVRIFFALGQRLVHVHRRPAGIGKNRIDPFALEAFDEDLRAAHDVPALCRGCAFGGGNFGAGLRFLAHGKGADLNGNLAAKQVGRGLNAGCARAAV